MSARRALVAVALAAALAAGLDGVSPAAAGPPDALAAALRLVQQARSEQGEQRDRTIAAALQALQGEPALAVAYPRWAQLLRSAADLSEAEAALSAALAVARVQPAQGFDAGDHQERLRALLAQPPFATVHWVDTVPEWLRPVAVVVEYARRNAEEALTWATAQALRFARAALETPLALAGTAAVVVGLASLYALALRKAMVREAAAPTPPGIETMTHEQALAQARALSQQGRHREACHYLLASVLLWCDAHGWLRFDASKTNREHLAQVRERHVRSRLAPLVERFDQLWYGQPEVGERDYRDLDALAAGLREAAA